MQTIWSTYLLSTLAASAVFVAAGWRSRQPIGTQPLFAYPYLGIHVLNHNGPADPAAPERDDVAAAIYIALARLASLISSQFVKVDVAVRPGMQVIMRSPLLADTIEELLTAALQAAPACRLLLTAAPHGDRVHISVTDDMPDGDPAMRIGRVRALTERIARRGDALVVDVRPQEGTTMTLRIAAAPKS